MTPSERVDTAHGADCGNLPEVWREGTVRLGSAARGDMRPHSDLDILVEFLPESKIGWEFFELEEELTLPLARKVDLGSKRSLKVVGGGGRPP